MNLPEIDGLEKYCPYSLEHFVNTSLAWGDELTITEKIAVRCFQEILNKKEVTLPLIKEIDRVEFNLLRQRVIEVFQNRVCQKPSALGQRIRAFPGDISLVCRNGELMAHKCAFSSIKGCYFDTEGYQNQTSVNLEDYSVNIVNIFIDLMYEIRFIHEVRFEDLLELYPLIDFLNLKDLGNACTEAIKAHVEFDKNVLPFFSEWVSNPRIRLPADIVSWRYDDNEIEKQLFDRFQQEAAHNDPIAIVNLGRCFSSGKGVSKDMQQAFLWYSKGLELRNRDALYEIGTFYSNGRVVEKDEKKAFALAKEAAELGCREGMNNVGYYYYEGRGIDKDEELGLYWVLESAKLGNPFAYANLAKCEGMQDHLKLDFAKKASKLGLRFLKI